MGILQSVLRCFGSETEDEYAISALNSYNLNTGGKFEHARRDNILASPYQWGDGNHSTRPHQTKYFAISAPNLRDSSSLADTSVNDKVKSSAVFIRENTPQNVCRRERIGIGSSSGGKGEEKRREEVPVKINYKVVATEGRWISTSVNDKVKSSAVFIKENIPQNVCRREKIGIGLSSGGKGEEKRREEVPVKISCKVVAPEERWIKHYGSCHRILLVGEGDFSFSTCLAAAFGKASNMVATSLDSQAFLMMNYRNALSNIVGLSTRKCKVMHEIDATKMANHAILGEIKFDRIIYNFPFAGFFKDMPRDYQLGRHRILVSLFMKNAKEMISENGEIHISHKTNGFHKEWKLESLASSQGLRLVEAVDFSLIDYPGYNTKCGFGGDNNFDCYPSKTYKFRARYIF